jgi:hypothetical protein
MQDDEVHACNCCPVIAFQDIFVDIQLQTVVEKIGVRQVGNRRETAFFLKAFLLDATGPLPVVEVQSILISKTHIKCPGKSHFLVRAYPPFGPVDWQVFVEFMKCLKISKFLFDCCQIERDFIIEILNGLMEFCSQIGSPLPRLFPLLCYCFFCLSIIWRILIVLPFFIEIVYCYARIKFTKKFLNQARYRTLCLDTVDPILMLSTIKLDERVSDMGVCCIVRYGILFPFLDVER